MTLVVVVVVLCDRGKPPGGSLRDRMRRAISISSDLIDRCLSIYCETVQNIRREFFFFSIGKGKNKPIEPTMAFTVS